MSLSTTASIRTGHWAAICLKSCIDRNGGGALIVNKFGGAVESLQPTQRFRYPGRKPVQLTPTADQGKAVQQQVKLNVQLKLGRILC